MSKIGPETILIIGNGFDLACGFPTSYKNYYESDYYKTKRSSVILFIDAIKNIQNCIKLQNKIPNFNNNNINVWDIFFAIVCKKNGNNKETWKDFEDEMRESFLPNDKWNNYSFYYCNPSVHFFNYDAIFAPIYIFLKTFCNLNLGMNNDDFNSVLFHNFLLDELKKFESYFGKYIFEVTANENIKENLLTNIFNLFETPIFDNSLIDIETFNYSDVKNPNRDYVHHINGDYNLPIFGIAPPLNAKISSSLYKFTKISRRIFGKVMKQHQTFDSNLKYIMFFGASLGEQDSTYIFALFDSVGLFEKNSHSVLIFVYYIYDTNKAQEIEEYEFQKVINILNRYDKARGLNGTLLELLTANGRVLIKKLDNLKPKTNDKMEIS